LLGILENQRVLRKKERSVNEKLGRSRKIFKSASAARETEGRRRAKGQEERFGT
jgi:hypothetical protein